MAITGNRLFGSFGDEKVVRTAQGGQKLGTLMELPDGSLYRYCKTGEALGAGTCIQTPLAIADHDMDLAIEADAAIGVRTFTVTLGSTLATVDQYKDGYVYINDGAGEGHKYRLRSNLAVASGQTFTCELEEKDFLREALTTATSLAGLMANPYNGALLVNTSPDGAATGFACTELASGEFGWLQTRGWGCVLIQGTALIGDVGVPSLNQTGAVDPHVGTGDAGLSVCLFTSPAAVGGDSGFAYITID